MKYAILSLVEPCPDRQKRSDAMDEGDRRQCYSIDPDVVYPATLNHFQDVLAGKESGQELLDGVETADAAKKLVADVKRLKEDGIELALTPYSKIHNLDVDQKLRRDKILELVRHWATRALRVKVKKPLWVHILCRPRWRLAETFSKLPTIGEKKN